MSYFSPDTWFNPNVFNPVEATAGVAIGLILGLLILNYVILPLWHRQEPWR